NLNTLQAFLDYYFPNYEKNPGMLANLFEDIISKEIQPETLIDYAQKIKPYVHELNNLVKNNSSLKITQSNILFYCIDLFNSKSDYKLHSYSRQTVIKKLKQIMDTK